MTRGPRDDAPVARDRPLHRRAGTVALVAAGGAAGTAARMAVAALVPGDGRWWDTWAVNLTGAFALGLLLEVLSRTGPDDGRRRAARLALGTGLLGGFTTYSTFALDTVTLAAGGRAAVAVAQAVGAVLAGLAAAAAGIAAGARVGHHPPGVATPAPPHASRPTPPPPR